MSEDEDGDDPFAELDDAVPEKDGDPFSELDDVEGLNRADETSGEPNQTDETSEGSNRTGDGPEEFPAELSADPADEPSTATGPERSDAPDDAAVAGEDPFADAETRAGDPFESDESVFERMDVGDVNPDEVWENLAAAERRGSVGEKRGRTYAEVSKHSYCERCEFFSAPPEVACTNEGTEILEFVDRETVRIVDCPVVAERRDLE